MLNCCVFLYEFACFHRYNIYTQDFRSYNVETKKMEKLGNTRTIVVEGLICREAVYFRYLSKRVVCYENHLLFTLVLMFWGPNRFGYMSQTKIRVSVIHCSNDFFKNCVTFVFLPYHRTDSKSLCLHKVCPRAWITLFLASVPAEAGELTENHKFLRSLANVMLVNEVLNKLFKK